ncbi:hypothetical protein DV736_g760, partial [Chaetothyriales sp. CBS 134916]
MSNSYSTTAPLSYKTPSFPSLYWPIRASVGEAKYLYHFADIWRFTLCWTLMTVGGAHFLVAAWAVLMQFASALQRRVYLDSGPGRALSPKNRRLFGENPIRQTVGWVWLIPLVYLVIGMAEAFVAGSLVGLILGVMYETGYFRMSTWTPLFWGVINMLMLVVASFKVQGGL